MRAIDIVRLSDYIGSVSASIEQLISDHSLLLLHSSISILHDLGTQAENSNPDYVFSGSETNELASALQGVGFLAQSSGEAESDIAIAQIVAAVATFTTVTIQNNNVST